MLNTRVVATLVIREKVTTGSLKYLAAIPLLVYYLLSGVVHSR